MEISADAPVDDLTHKEGSGWASINHLNVADAIKDRFGLTLIHYPHQIGYDTTRYAFSRRKENILQRSSEVHNGGLEKRCRLPAYLCHPIGRKTQFCHHCQKRTRHFIQMRTLA
jgi:hypothetical protein